MTQETNATIEDVYNFWNENFLYSFELKEEKGTKEFYNAIDKLRKEDIEKYCVDFWQFDKHAGEKVLDIGCGPGWLVRNFAQNEADVYAVDIADVAVDLTKKMLETFGLSANVQTASAENLPFEDNTFDFVSSNGVLHHTPDMQKAIDEAYRVLKPGCEAVISVYYKNIFFSPVLFPFFLFVYRVFKPKVPGRDKMKHAKSVDDFIRMYDGEENPVGYGVTKKECYKMFSKFEILKHEIHFFPKRFFPLFNNCPDFIYKQLDKYLGTMIYLRLRKSQ